MDFFKSKILTFFSNYNSAVIWSRPLVVVDSDT